MASVLSLAAGVSPELGSDPAAFVRAAAAGGWRACGIWFDPATWSSATTSAVRGALAETGVTPLDIEVVRLGQGDPQPVVEAAHELGVPNLLCVSFLPDPGATADHYAALAERCAPAGVRACLEFMPFSTVRTLDDAVDVATRAGSPAAAVLVDTLHLVRSGGAPDDLRTIDEALLPYAQWCDGVAQLDDTSPQALVADALDGRSCPGEGELPVAAFVDALPPGLPLSLEIRSAALRAGYEDPVDRAREILRRTQAIGPLGSSG
jgi:sugar phosphate isomerase/epimerase